MNMRRLFAIVLKEMRQMRRDRITLAMIVGIPVMQLVLFGYAINLNLRGLETGVADQANTAASRAVVMDMVATGVIKPTHSANTPQELMTLLRARRDQPRRSDSAGLRAASLRRPRGGAGARRRQRHGRAERRGAAVAAAAGHHESKQHDARRRIRQHATHVAGQRGRVLQPGASFGGQHRARPDRRDPDHDDGAVHRRRHRPRARARQHGAADRHAGQPQRADDRQGAAVRGDRPGADHGGAAARRLAVRCAGARQRARRLHRGGRC